MYSGQWREMGNGGKQTSSGGSLIISYLSLCGREWGGAGRLFEAGTLLNFLP